jgi:uncharacterized protein YyaL (SSP411 family)
MPNHLAGQRSAYLRQHQDNPVDWYPWGSEPFERATAEGKPILVSIGYSSCHWCHVMEHESFEDPDVARLMNENLVCIKVDREERPDVDQIYMEAVMRLTGSGGWPLNAFCTPDGRPFFGGTYFAPTGAYGRPSWKEIVLAMVRAYREEPDQVEAQAERILEILRARPSPGNLQRPGRDELHEFTLELLRRADRAHGGFGGAPKFPTPTNLEGLLLAQHLRVASAGCLEQVVLTLKRMARGGIYDQLGGGFHRYSVDERWLVPHFEKMLYDQGQLLRVYAEAYRQTRDPELAWPLEETVAYLEREMRSDEGAFYSSQDADSEGEEGRYYVWTPDQVSEVLGEEEGARFCEAYGVLPGGNFEHSEASVLSHVLAGERGRFAPQRAKLLDVRSRRTAPETDTKQITSWIAYVISGLATAAAAFDRGDWVRIAARATNFVLERLTDETGRLFRVGYGTTVKIPAFLDDHASLLMALLDLDRAGAPDRVMEPAIRVAEAIRDRFYDPEARDLFFVPSDTRDLVLRPRSDVDGATPSAAGLATLGLARLGTLTGRADLREVAEAVLATWDRAARQVPTQFPTLLRAGALLDSGPGVALVLGDTGDPRTVGLAARARQVLCPEDAVVVVPPGAPPTWLDPTWLQGREAINEQPTAYVCRGEVCSLPTTDPGEIRLPAETRPPRV